MKAQITDKPIGIVFLVVLAGGFAQAAVINVPADFGTIQGAISDAGTVDGDEIVVASGTYPEVIDFIGKAITVRSASGDPNDTIIDGTGNFHVVQCINGEDPNSVLSGFTITGGNANGSNPDNYGGGMYNDNSSPTVTNCTFVGNSATQYGGGMYNYNSSPTVTNCTFVGNSVSTWGGGGGGMANDDSNPTVINCTFSGNSSSSEGGGMYNSGYNNPTVTNCTFSDNTASFLGGGMYNHFSSPTVTNCTFSGNTAPLGGGGMGSGFSGSKSKVTNCTFSGNTGGDLGGGMGLFFGASSTVTNCTFSGNTSTVDGGGIASSSILTVTNCIFWENSDAGGMDESAQIWASASSTPVVNYSNIQGGWTGPGGTGNLNADPNFADADGADNTVGTVDDDFRLLAGSPCIDAGDISVVTESTDRDGNPRLIDDPNTPDTGTGSCPFRPVDMGAYEFFIDDDEDDDTVSNACDTCPGFDDLIDTDNDGHPNDCDVCEGFDDDATLEDFFNSGGTDSDGDGIPDVCDQCILPGDINCDGIVDLLDLGLLALHFLETI